MVYTRDLADAARFRGSYPIDRAPASRTSRTRAGRTAGLGPAGRRTELTRIEIWARPSSRLDRIEWDEWRKRWLVSCRAPAEHGAANEAIRRVIAAGLDVPLASVRYARAGRARSKSVEIEGLTAAEVETRLRHGLPPGGAGEARSSRTGRTPGARSVNERLK